MRLIRLLIFMFFNVARRLQRRWRRDANGKSRALMLDHFWLGDRVFNKTIFAATAVAAFIAAPALASDLPVKAPPRAPVVGGGCYVNGGVGYGLSNRDHFSFNETGFVNRDGTSGARGYLGRVGGGCDYQFSPAGGWATGSSARSPDYDLMNLHGGFTDAATLVTAPSRENWAAAAGGRIGFGHAASPDLCERRLDLNAVQWRRLPPGADHLASTDF
jgi:hypothetical protein